MAAQLKKVTMKGPHSLLWQTLYFPLIYTVISKAHSLEHSTVLTKYITNSNTLLSFLTPLFLAFFLLQGFVFSPMGSLHWNWGLSIHATVYNNLLESSPYLWRSNSNSRQGSIIENFWSQWGCCGWSLAIWLATIWLLQHVCFVFYFHSSFWLLCIEYVTLKALD